MSAAGVPKAVKVESEKWRGVWGYDTTRKTVRFERERMGFVDKILGRFFVV